MDRRWEVLGKALQEQLNAAGHVAKLIDDKLDGLSAHVDAHMEAASAEQAAAEEGRGVGGAEHSIEQSIALADRLAEVGTSIQSAQAVATDAMSACDGFRAELSAFKEEATGSNTALGSKMHGAISEFEARCQAEFSKMSDVTSQVDSLGAVADQLRQTSDR